MSKVSRKCPICDGNFVIVMVNKGTQIAWPECWKCDFNGHTPEDKEAMSIDIKLNPHLDSTGLFKEALDAWEEYLTLLDEENIKEPKENN